MKMNNSYIESIMILWISSFWKTWCLCKYVL